jgi:hypothetical protein
MMRALDVTSRWEEREIEKKFHVVCGDEVPVIQVRV